MCAFESEVFVLPTSVRIWHWDGPLSDTATNKSTIKLPNSIPVTPAEMNLSAPVSQLWRLGSRAGGRSMSVFLVVGFPLNPPIIIHCSWPLSKLLQPFVGVTFAEVDWQTSSGARSLGGGEVCLWGVLAAERGSFEHNRYRGFTAERDVTDGGLKATLGNIEINF